MAVPASAKNGFYLVLGGIAALWLASIVFARI